MPSRMGSAHVIITHPHFTDRRSPAAVTAKVGQMHGAGTLGKLTVPELKAYLRSVGRPVGGKKGELEERVRQQLGTAGL